MNVNMVACLIVSLRLFRGCAFLGSVHKSSKNDWKRVWNQDTRFGRDQSRSSWLNHIRVRPDSGAQIATQSVIGRPERGFNPEVRFVPGTHALGMDASFQEFPACLSYQLSVGRIAGGQEGRKGK